MDDDEEGEATPNDLFLDAVRAGDIETVRQLLANPVVCPTVIDAWSGSNALHYAAANGHVDVLKLLVCGSERINIKLPSTCEVAATESENQAETDEAQKKREYEALLKRIKIVQAVRDVQGVLAQQHAANFSGSTPLMWACQERKWEAATFLTIAFYDQIDVLAKNFAGASALNAVMNAASWSEGEELQIGLLLKLLLEHPTAVKLEEPYHSLDKQPH